MNLDAVLYLSLLNSRNSQYVSGAHARVALLLKRLEIEVIPVGYVLVEPGMKLGEVGDVDLVSRDNFGAPSAMLWRRNSWACPMFTWKRATVPPSPFLRG